MNQPLLQPFQPRRAQHGAATLVVVLVLFFVISLTAAYASRNLIFEQRTSVNQYHSTQSFEAAEAGLEWAVAMLNSGRIDDSCQPTADTTKDNFRQRYLTTDITTGLVTQKLQADGVTPLWAACSFDGTGWQCSCTTATPAAAALPVQGVAFAVRFVTAPAVIKPGMVRIEVNGCNSYDVSCVTAGNYFQIPFCQSTVCSLLALHSGAKSPPAAAVTAQGSISGSGLGASNQVSASGGLTLHAGGAITVPTIGLSSLPGTPGALSIRANDGALAATDNSDCLQCNFASVFGLRPTTYRQQPATVQVDCALACSAATVNAALAAARGPIIWLRNVGGLTLDNPADMIGSAFDPVVLVIEGPLTVSAAAGASARIHGLVYAGSASVDAGEIHGALVSGSNVTGAGSGQVFYDAGVLNRLKLTAGSYVRVPGGWRDFP